MRATTKSYITGFVLSVILTLIPYYLVVERVMTGWMLIIYLMVFAVVQLLVQLEFFIHLAPESGPRWNVLVFLFMGLVLLIIVLGSLWIMDNLDYHNMTPEETNAHIQDEEAIYR